MENNEMELINRLSRKKLKEEDVYIFPVTLCDNEIDRDFESFTVQALYELKELFIGKTGISDHSMRSSDQSARVFMTWVEETPGRTTKRGEKYTALKAKAYMVRTRRNEDLIKEIDAGIKKEVSVSCSVTRHICSVCGKERCSHVRGKTYDGQLCYTLLSGATDAYEWSFVAVPAQREAGVTKSYKKEKEKMENPADIIKSAFSQREEKNKVFCYLEELEREAEDGRKYREELMSDVRKLLAVSLPVLSPADSAKVCGSLSTQSLSELKKSLSKNTSALSCTPQTAKKNEKTNTQSVNDYMI